MAGGSGWRRWSGCRRHAPRLLFGEYQLVIARQVQAVFLAGVFNEQIAPPRKRLWLLIRDAVVTPLEPVGCRCTAGSTAAGVEPDSNIGVSVVVVD
jgi:hypothetical protein